MLKRLLIASVLTAIGCVNVVAEDTITKTTEVKIVNPYWPLSSTVSIPPTTLSQSVPVDISKTLSDVGKVGTLSLVVNSNTVNSNTGDFSFFDEVSVSISPDNTNNSGLPPLTIVDMQLTSDQKLSSDLAVPMLVDGSALLQYFQSGGLNMSFTVVVEGSPPQSIDLSDTLSMSVSIVVDKSISDLNGK